MPSQTSKNLFFLLPRRISECYRFHCLNTSKVLPSTPAGAVFRFILLKMRLTVRRRIALVTSNLLT